ncbi:MAG: type III pantothenate kinase [Candidatus Meridianibacter frigidus]|nr:MAG: type III pantothenate kinase [Candidatus Eremiobacteraeota bacterium]
MLLAIDIGNTETKLGIFDGDELLHRWRVTTDSRRTGDEYGVFLRQLLATSGVNTSAIDGVAVASVVPKLDQVLHEACERFFDRAPAFLKPHRQRIIPVRTDRPSEVGADLVAAAIGARASYGAPLIVISYGTATAFVAISDAGEFVGTAIAPGISISVDALVGRAAKLPQIALEAPGQAIGRETIASLQSGIVYGFVGQTEGLVARFRSELGGGARVIATGGLAAVVAKHTPVIDTVDTDLSLRGLKLFSKHQA